MPDGSGICHRDSRRRFRASSTVSYPLMSRVPRGVPPSSSRRLGR